MQSARDSYQAFKGTKAYQELMAYKEAIRQHDLRVAEDREAIDNLKQKMAEADKEAQKFDSLIETLIEGSFCLGIVLTCFLFATHVL